MCITPHVTKRECSRSRDEQLNMVLITSYSLPDRCMLIQSFFLLTLKWRKDYMELKTIYDLFLPLKVSYVTHYKAPVCFALFSPMTSDGIFLSRKSHYW